MTQEEIYTTQPSYENELVLLRPITKEDAPALLLCYADAHAVPFFNSDNCQGDDFHYTTLTRMQEAIDFWAMSYRERYFVRWAVVDQSLQTVVGTVEMFHRRAKDAHDHAGVLRIDLQSRFETRTMIYAVLCICLTNFYDAFEVETILTKAVPRASERCVALTAADFTPCEAGLMGYGDYWKRNRCSDKEKKDV